MTSKKVTKANTTTALKSSLEKIPEKGATVDFGTTIDDIRTSSEPMISKGFKSPEKSNDSGSTLGKKSSVNSSASRLSSQSNNSNNSNKLSSANDSERSNLSNIMIGTKIANSSKSSQSSGGSGNFGSKKPIRMSSQYNQFTSSSVEADLTQSSTSFSMRSPGSHPNSLHSFSKSFRDSLSFRSGGSSIESGSTNASVLEETPSSFGIDIKVIPGKGLHRKTSRLFQIEEIDQRLANIPHVTSDNAITNGNNTNINTNLPSIRESSEVSAITVSTFSHTFDLNPLPTIYPQFKNDLNLESFNRVKHLTDGSNSNIFKAHMGNNEQNIILKVIKDAVIVNPIAIKEFEREVLIISRLNHPHILSIYGSGFVKSKKNDTFMRPLIVLEALDGNSLTHHLNMKRSFHSVPFTTPRYLRIAKEFADALYYLHDKLHPDCMLIHRDLKPDNVGFTISGVLKLMDFGLCICLKKSTSYDGVYKLTGETGSRRYMAPEVALNKRYNEKVDMYSYGIMLYELITGATPFSGFTLDTFDQRVFHKHERPPMDYDIYGREVKMAQSVKTLIIKCWDKSATNRPSAKEAYELFLTLENTAIEQRKNQNCMISCLQAIFNKRDSI